MRPLKTCNRIIEFSFYSLFFLTPIVFWKDTFELFEMNKMWLVWALTIIIAMAWLIKMVLQKKIIFQRTPLDIPIGLLLLSQIISTIFSIDSHTSVWGYYSRFNGGLLSIISYVLLYYAFLSNLSNLRYLRQLLFLSLVSGAIVALWGLPSHFGYDPTCLLFRGTFDVSCWTQDFMPKVRIFSTLGQPDWLAAYFAILIPIAITFALQKTQNTQTIGSSENQKIRKSETLAYRVFRVFWNKQTVYLLLIALFYFDLLYTRARSGFLGIWIALIFFAGLYLWTERKKINSSSLISHFSFLIGLFLLITFVIGTPISQLRIFTLEGISSQIRKIQAPKTTIKQEPAAAPVQSFESGGGGTESGKIRLLVWEGAIKAWRANPLFGTGVETFAFAYYKYKPAGQNLTSEWNFLYNKAHNEYLNYLATTGIFGLGSYLLMIGTFLLLTIKKILFSENSEYSENQKLRQSDNLNIRKSGTPSFPSILTMALVASYISILVTNFFGFSVVITNVYLFMIPAFVFVLTRQTESRMAPVQTNKAMRVENGTSVWQWTPIFFTLVIGIFMLYSLARAWQADTAFALGYNLDRAGEYEQGYPNLHKAVQIRGSEPVFKDELSINNAIIAAALVAQKPQDEKTQQNTINVASSLAQEAINVSNEVVSQHPNNAVFWKTRVRVFYTLSQADSRYLPRALDAIVKASLLAPNDANIWYNLGVLYGQNGNIEKGIEALEKTIILKPDYRDAHFGLGLFYHTKSLDGSGKIIVDENLNQKAIAQMQYILDSISPEDSGAIQSLEDWSK